MRRPGLTYAFGDFRLDPRRRQLLRRGGEIVAIGDIAFDTLLHLVEHAGEVVARGALLKAVCPHAAVVENSVNQAVTAVRRALGDDPAAPRYLATVTGRGYRFLVAAVPEDHADRDPEAFQHYVAGWATLTRPGRGNLKTAQAHFERAVALDPGFALAHVRLGESHHLQGSHGAISPHAAYPPALAHARKALEIDPRSAEAHALLSQLAFAYELDAPRAEVEMRRALELDPACFLAHRSLAVQLTSLGRHEEAIEAARRAQAIEPLAASANGNIGVSLFFAGRYEEAIDQLERTLRLDETWLIARSHLGQCWLQLGHFARAMEAFEHALQPPRGRSWDIAAGLAAAGRQGEARHELARLMQPPDGVVIRPIEPAMVHALLGDTEEALALVEQVIDQRMNAMILGVHPTFRRLHFEPRFKRMLEGIGLRGVEPAQVH